MAIFDSLIMDSKIKCVPVVEFLVFECVPDSSVLPTPGLNKYQGKQYILHLHSRKGSSR